MGVHLERDREAGVVHGKQRTPCELPRERPEPDAEERDGRRQVEPVEAQLPGMEGGRDQPEQVHPPHEEEEPGNPDELPEVALEVAREQEDEGHGKVEERERERHGAPSPREPVVEEADFFRQVARPDDEELREGEVGPEHREREKELAEVVYVAGLEDFLHRSVPREEKADDEGECEARERLAADHVHAVDRREPVQVERHEEIDRDDADEQAVEREPGPRDEPHLPLEAGLGRVVLSLRHAAQRLREDRPEKQADCEPDRNAGGVHVNRAVTQDLVGGDAAGIRPRVEVPEPEEERHREERDERDRARRRLEDAPNDEAPGTARHGVEHRDREASEGDTEDERERDKVGPEELGGIRHEARERHEGEESADDEAAPPEGSEVGGGRRDAGFGHLLSEEESFSSSSFRRNSFGMWWEA